MSALATLPESGLAQGANPIAMLNQLIQQGTDVDKLGKLMDLAERWKADQAASEFAAALNECQQVMPCVVKDRTNEFTKSKYATLENVNSIIKPVYTRHGFSLSYGMADSPVEGCIRVVCDVAHTGGHTRRYHLDCPSDTAGAKGGSNKTGVQGLGSTVTYARRYLALMIFNVTVADQDMDGNAAENFDTITEAEVLEVEDEINDRAVDRVRFLDWCEKAGVLANNERKIEAITRKGLAKVLHILRMKKASAR